jgi:hypothetical protein
MVDQQYALAVKTLINKNRFSARLKPRPFKAVPFFS